MELSCRSGCGLCSAGKIYHVGVSSHIINPLLTKLVWSRWLDLFFMFLDLDFASVHKLARKELGQYPAILTSRLVNNPYIFTCL